MITKKFVYLTSIIVFFSSIYISCNMNASNKYTSKDTIKPFDHLNDPIVFAQMVVQNNTFLGIKLSPKLVGYVLIVIDIETQSIHDWIFVPNLYGYDVQDCCKVTIPSENGSRNVYCCSISSSGTIVILDPTKTQLEYKSTGYKDIGYICHKSTPSSVVLTDMIVNSETEGPSDLLFTAYDIDTNSSKQIRVSNTTREFLPYKTFSNGDLLVTTFTDTNCKLWRINIADSSTSEICTFSRSKKDYYFQRIIYDNKIFIIKRNTNYIDDTIIIYDLTNKSIKEITMPSEYNGDYLFGPFFTLNSNIYVTISETNGDKVLIKKLNSTTCAFEDLPEPFNTYNPCGKLYVCDSKLYFFDDATDFSFTVYDFEKKEIKTSKIKKVLN